MTVSVDYDPEDETIELDTGLHYIKLNKEEALDLIKKIQKKITKSDLEKYQKDWNYEGSTI